MMSDRTPGANVRAYYDRFMFDEVIDAFYGQSDFHNFGLWDDDTRSAADASVALMNALVDLAPPNPRHVLEVGCGKGATTRALRARWPDAAITAIDVSETQLGVCRRNCPDVTFLLMDACDMTFDAARFDVVISVEAAFHFPSRQRFLTHARRVLQPHGRLMLQDVLYHQHDASRQEQSGSLEDIEEDVIIPPENYISGPEEYSRILRDAGFARSHVIDVTDAGPVVFYQAFLRHLSELGRRAGDEGDRLRRLRLGIRIIARRISYCLLATADPSPAQ